MAQKAHSWPGQMAVVGAAFGAIVSLAPACAPVSEKGGALVTDTGGSDVADALDSREPDTGAPDDGRDCIPPGGKECTTLPQCGCYPDENCAVTNFTDGTASCVPAGPLALHDRCFAQEDCPKGTSCVGKICRPFCNATSDCKGSILGVCQNVEDFTTMKPIPGWKVCLVECDPMKPLKNCGKSGCGFDQKNATTVCVPAGTSIARGGCSIDNSACAPGYACLLVTFDCRKWCRIGQDAADCGGSRKCDPLTNAPSWKGVTYGVCTY